MNYEEIIPEFEVLKQEILDFKYQMTVDDFYFYERKRTKKFEGALEELCEKHFGTHWWSLEDQFLKWYSDASKSKEPKLKKSIHALNAYFFARDLSYKKKYETEYKYDPDEEPDWKGRSFPIGEKQVWKGEYEVYNQRIENEECFKTDIEITKPVKQNILLKNWRTIVTTLIEQRWKAFSGIFDVNDRIVGFYDHEIPRELSITDYSCFLALKNALRSDLFITTHENEILMVVSSGIAAKIAFRKTGKYALEMTDSEQQIYSMTNFSHENDYKYADKTVLHISGYTNSEINVHIPNGYYFVSHDYIVELEFIAAPILLNNGVIPMMVAANISSEELLDDEEEEQKRLGEDY
ncbi:MAG: hypothetical protein V4604_02505 [Bacteroidota bacterium]